MKDRSDFDSEVKWLAYLTSPEVDGAPEAERARINEAILASIKPDDSETFPCTCPSCGARMHGTLRVREEKK